MSHISSTSNKHILVFEKLTVLYNSALIVNPEWLAQLRLKLPGFQPDTTYDLNRTIVCHETGDITAIYRLQIWNNIASCSALYGTPTTEHIASIIRFLQHTIKTNILDERLALECSFKCFVYVPAGMTVPTHCKRSCSQAHKDIFGGSVSPYTQECIYDLTKVPTSTFGTPAPATGTQFKFGVQQPSTGFTFGTKTAAKPTFSFGGTTTTTTTTPTYTFGSKTPAPAPTPSFTFGAPQTPATPSFTFGSSTTATTATTQPTYTFGAKPQQSTFGMSKPAFTGFGNSTQTKPTFSFGTKPKPSTFGFSQTNMWNKK